MIENCILHNKRKCSRKKSIERYKQKCEILIVYGFDWGVSSDTNVLISDFFEDKIKPTALQLGMDFKFEFLGGKDGSIYCNICYLIQKADIALFDISTNNPNVIFELGLAVGSGAYVYMLKSRHRHPLKGISDLSGILEYRFTRRGGRLQFDADLEKSLKTKIRLIAQRRL